MKTVKELLDAKGHEVWSVSPEHTVFEAIEIKAERKVGALPVISESGELAGIISERDYARKVVLKDQSPRDTRVADIMTKDVVVVYEDTPISHCLVLMHQHNFRHLIAVKGKQVIGIVAVGDLLEVIIEEQNKVIEELESAIFVEEGGEG